MKRRALLVGVVVSALAVAAAAQQPEPVDQRALRSRIEARFDVVPLTAGLALRPKERLGDVRLVEVSNGEVSINGVVVTGRELRERIGAEADAVVQLSYMDAAALAALFGPRGEAREPAERESEMPQPVERDPATEPKRDDSGRERQRSSGDRVRVFGNVSVSENERIGGATIAVMGSARVDGEVEGDVVAVLGSVHLGPKAVVRGEVVSVGGRVHRSSGSQARGGVTEVAFGDGPFNFNIQPRGGDWGPLPIFAPWGAVPRLIGSVFRLLLLALLAALAFLVARRTAEASAQRIHDNPAKAVLVGLASQLVLWPALFLTAVVLAITVIGIPLLLLLPFAVLMILLIALVGFSGAALAIGQWTRRRTGITGASSVADVCLGVLVLLLPVLLARVVGLVGWPVTPLAFVLLATGVAVEFLAWAGGFGAIVSNTLSSWEARRASRTAPPPVVP